MATKYNDPEREGEEEEEEDEEEEEGSQGEVWDDWQSDEEDASSDYMCLFCDLRYDSTERLLEHCKFVHSFDFRGIVRELKMDFYGSFKLINYIRSQVAINKCWSCDLLFKCITDLQNHLHTADNIKKDGKFPWDDDLYLKPFMIDDALLHSFADDEDEEDFDPPVTKEEILSELINDGDIAEIYNSSHDILDNEKPQTSACHDFRRDVTAEENVANLSEKSKSNGICGGSGNEELTRKRKDCQLKVSFANVVTREIKNANDSYFGSYGSFGIHREMISDKVRTEAYRIAILNNPSLLNQATIMDVGCGTGILSLFAAQAGVSRVIAVEASLKMATIATQIAKDNGFLYEENNKGEKGEENHCSGVINVVQTMVEELDKLKKIPPHSVDVLVSEWMGYCLLYESMLSSVLYARDHWLKPGGAILPDTATIFVAGFGRGGTSLPFWENVYGFNMSCIGKEVMEDAACFPIIDVMDSKDIVTKSVVLQTFDLTTMKPDEMDFTSSCELVLKPSTKEGSADSEALICLCYGIVLWFEASFTNRFCKETPTALSTSPYSPKTHWSQAIFTFQEPIAMTYTKAITGYDGVLGTEQCPAARISSRISIARSSVHRSIDISMETTGISVDGRKRRWPVQIFNL